MPQIILPEPKVSFTMPPMPKVGPEIKFEGHPSIMPNIIPVLPEPLVTVEVPKGGMNTAPKVNTDITQKKVTIDLSQVCGGLLTQLAALCCAVICCAQWPA